MGSVLLQREPRELFHSFLYAKTHRDVGFLWIRKQTPTRDQINGCLDLRLLRFLRAVSEKILLFISHPFYGISLEETEWTKGFPGGLDGKESACNAGDPIPGLERSPGEGNGYPLQYSCLENSMDREAWWCSNYRSGHLQIFPMLSHLWVFVHVKFSLQAAIHHIDELCLNRRNITRWYRQWTLI